MKFSEMPIGTRFECWGDIDLGIYEYPRVCTMEKRDDISAYEIIEGIKCQSVLICVDCIYDIVAAD